MAMKYTMNFGKLTAQRPRTKSTGQGFRIAVLGDFSGRTNAGLIETGAALSERKPIRIDVDNFESVFRRIAPRLRLPIEGDGGLIELTFGSMDDFHPDQLYHNLELFTELAELRKRLKNEATYAAASQEMRSWKTTSAVNDAECFRAKLRGTAIPHGKLDDFARLISRRASTVHATPVDELLRRIIAPYIVPMADPEQQSLIAAIDEILTASMRRILHDADFQSLESQWRMVELLIRNLEIDSQLQIVLYDITAEELAADLSSTDTLEKTGLYRLIVDRPFADGRQEALSVLLGNYFFELIPPHAELVGRIGKIAATAQAPFLAGITADCLVRQTVEEVHPLITESWNALRSMPCSQYVGLTVPRFLLRWPYGEKTEPIESFPFEEFTPQYGLKGMLWGNGSILAGVLLGKTFMEQGLSEMQLGSNMMLGDMPFYYYTDEDGDQVALPSTECWVSESLVGYTISQNLMPVLSIRGRPEIRLGSFCSLHGAELAGPWAPLLVEADEALKFSDEEHSEIAALKFETYEAQAATEASDELDALLAKLDLVDSDINVTAASKTSELGSNELDDLLSALESKETRSSFADNKIDPELAKLLANL